MPFASRLLVLLSLAALPAAAQPAPDRAAPEALGFTAEGLARIGPALQRYVDDGTIAGAVALVARRGGVALWEGVGYQDRAAGAPMPPDALFRIASMTKPIVSAAVLILYDEGRFSLDDPVATYLPAFADVAVYAGEAADGTLRLEPPPRPVTIRDLLTHTSGVSSPDFGQTPVHVRHREVNAAGVARSGAEEVALLAAVPLQHAPGAGWTYGLSTDVLAHLVEVVSGQPVQRFLKERLFGPLGMTDTGYHVPAARLPRLAALYARAEDGALQPIPHVPAEPPALFRGNTGLVSSAADYFRFAQMLLDDGALGGTRILRPETARLMRTNQLDEALLPLRTAGMDFPGPGHGFGLGVAVVTDEAAVRLPYSEGSAWWIGAANTYFWYDPAEQLVGVLMTQLRELRLHPFYPEFVQLVYGALAEEG